MAPPVVDLVSNVDVRKQWDKQFPTIEIVEQYSDYCCIHWLVNVFRWGKITSLLYGAHVLGRFGANFPGKLRFGVNFLGEIEIWGEFPREIEIWGEFPREIEIWGKFPREIEIWGKFPQI